MRDVLADDTFATARDCLLKLTVLITKNDSQAIQFPRNQNRTVCSKADQILDGLGLLRREHRLGVPNRDQLLQNLTGHLLGGRSRKNLTSFSFQFLKLIGQKIIFPIRHDGIVIPVVGNIGHLQLVDQFLHTKDFGFIHTHSCVPPFL